MITNMTLEHQIRAFMRSMEEEGITNSNFRQVRELKEINGPFYFAELIPDFCSDFEAIMKKLTVALNNKELDFHEVNEFSFKIEGSAGSIGAQKTLLACTDFRKASDIKSKEGCLLAFKAVEQAYSNLKERLDVLLLLECKIVAGPIH